MVSPATAITRLMIGSCSWAVSLTTTISPRSGALVDWEISSQSPLESVGTIELPETLTGRTTKVKTVSNRMTAVTNVAAIS